MLVPLAMVIVGAPDRTIEVSAGMTVRVVDPLTVPTVAEMVVEPGLTAVASPPEAMVATAVFDEAQVAVAVRT